MDQESTGQRIARARRRRGLPQTVLAGLIGRSESWLSQVERGTRRIDSHTVLTRLADVLRVPLEEITGPGDGDGACRAYPAAELIEQAMMRRGIAGDQHEPALGNLRDRARVAYRSYQATRYDDTGRALPDLIRDAEAASQISGLDEQAVAEVRAAVYDTAAALLNRVGEPLLAWTAADRALSAAEQSGSPVLAAVGAWRLSYVVTSRKHPQHGLELAMSAAEALERSMVSPSADHLSVYGALHLAAATAASECRDPAATATLLARARDIAGETGDSNCLGTGFGPVNVAIHTLSTSVRLGDARAAAVTGEALDASVMPAGLIGRRTQVRLDLATAYAMRKQDAAAVNLLLGAEQLSPQLIRYDRRTRDLLTELLRREHRPSTPALRPLARRAGVI
jgi:transcriptional regulator with XRE-family HTH domain